MGNQWGIMSLLLHQQWPSQWRWLMPVSPVSCPSPPRRWSRHSSCAPSWCQSKPLQRRRQAAAQEPAANRWADRTMGGGGRRWTKREVKRWWQIWGQRDTGTWVGDGRKWGGEKRLVCIPTWVTYQDNSRSHVLIGWFILGWAIINATK